MENNKDNTIKDDLEEFLAKTLLEEIEKEFIKEYGMTQEECLAKNKRELEIWLEAHKAHKKEIL